MAKVPNLRDWRPDDSDAKKVEDTKMLSTTARESVDMNESNVVGQESVTMHPKFPDEGAKGRN